MRLFLSILICPMICWGAEWSPPAVNIGWWDAGTEVGVSGGIDQYLPGGASDRMVINGIDVTQAPYNADNTGATDVYAAVTNAMDHAIPVGAVYFPAGVYKFDTRVVIEQRHSGISFRGAGWSTILSNSVGTDLEMFTFSGYDGGSDTIQTVTGTKTKGTTSLTVADSSGFAAHILGRVDISNEEDNTRIDNGAAPTWSSTGYRNLRSMVCYITAVAAGSVTIDPGLPIDCTDYTVTISRGSLTNYHRGIGFENFTIAFDGTGPIRGISLYKGVDCWVYGLNSTNWTRNAFNGQIVNMAKCYHSEIRKNKFISHTNYSDDGAIQTYESTSCLVVDNIFRGWDAGIYEFGNGYNNVYAFNYLNAGEGLIHHKGHSLLSLIYGNAISSVRPGDGYHMSSSHHSVIGNWIMQEYEGMNWYGFAANRFNRNHVCAWNIVGEDNRADGAYSLGYPNIGNLDSTGTATPTSGDFWADWGMTGTLTTRTSDSVGVLTVSGGDFDQTTGGGISLISAWWSSFATSNLNMTLTGRSGLALDIDTGGSGAVLPAAMTTCNVWIGTAGYQERDLDVEPSITFVENYEALLAGPGSVQDGTADTIPILVYSSKPSWFGDRPWPPYDPNSVVFSEDQIPAGYRALNNDADPPPGSVTGTKGKQINIKLRR